MSLYLIETFPVGPLQCNCAIVAEPTTREAVVIDPGDEPDRILEALSGAGLKAVALVHTHAHFDHVGCSALLKRITGAPILMHAGDRPLYQNLTVQGEKFGLSLDAPGIIDRTLVAGDRVACGKGELEARRSSTSSGPARPSLHPRPAARCAPSSWIAASIRRSS